MPPEGVKAGASSEVAVVNGVPASTSNNANLDPGLKELDGKLTSILKVGSRFNDDDDEEEDEGDEGGREGQAAAKGEGEEEDAEGKKTEPESPTKPHQNNRSHA